MQNNSFKLLSISTILLVSLSFFQTKAQDDSNPKLVVGVIIDQMRADYLYKYQDRYGEDGFKRLIRNGFNYKNANVNYIPAETAPGHASIYTGTTPSYHGIIGNSWFDRETNTVEENVSDSLEKIVGSVNDNPYGVSPNKLMSSTITDELKKISNFKSKIISVSIKDRGAILPGGKSADGVYWHDWESSPGYFVSSSFYMETLPNWVDKFNKQEKSDAYLDETWNTLYPIETYISSSPDDNTYEPSLGGKISPTFPYNFKTMREKYRDNGSEFQLLWISPKGNTLLTEFAITAIQEEKLGKDKYTDFLNISYSVPDVIGHTFGPQSVEMEDIYLRLDNEIATLLKALDTKIGKENYTLFLTSDHGAIENVSFLNNHKLDAAIARTTSDARNLEAFLDTKYGKASWITAVNGNNLYLNKVTVDEQKLTLPIIQKEAADYLMTLPEVSFALTADDLQTYVYEEGIRKTIQNGYHVKRSGDVIISYSSGTIIHPNPNIDVEMVNGTVHGSGYSYDTHVPLIWMGKGIKSGESVRAVNPIDIAPSLSMFLNIPLPSASQGKPLIELFEN
ncbi:alkaline phosphatase family protein [Maribacter arcticus]|uniref:Type I phosphodiesterase / nucleotide pyrophosphatase n=1 Tax=Maribacter arcticus TaxID=561365 RepID=A0A1T5ADE1_9FLAO|nr:alkaline phosphatase family protein [Maribacter arcticus]SKB32747.1 Type I phosphodiesterase / nucleotide pyrophosphatase [Maribacter arcticus]